MLILTCGPSQPPPRFVRSAASAPLQRPHVLGVARHTMSADLTFHSVSVAWIACTALVFAGAAVQVAVGAGLSVICGPFLLLWLGFGISVSILLVPQPPGIRGGDHVRECRREVGRCRSSVECNSRWVRLRLGASVSPIRRAQSDDGLRIDGTTMAKGFSASPHRLKGVTDATLSGEPRCGALTSSLFVERTGSGDQYGHDVL
jgi:hypothetical protein